MQYYKLAILFVFWRELEVILQIVPIYRANQRTNDCSGSDLWCTLNKVWVVLVRNEPHWSDSIVGTFSTVSMRVRPGWGQQLIVVIAAANQVATSLQLFIQIVQRCTVHWSNHRLYEKKKERGWDVKETSGWKSKSVSSCGLVSTNSTSTLFPTTHPIEKLLNGSEKRQYKWPR